MMDNFNGGYVKALLDVRAFFSNHSDGLKRCNLYSQKGVLQVVDALIKNREELKETGDLKRLKYNMMRKEFVYDQD